MASWKEPKSDYTVGSQVTADIFNNLAENEKYLNQTKIATNDVEEAIITSTESGIRTNLYSQETIKGAFGKIRKWFSDLKTLAFKDKVASEDITSLAVDKVIGLHLVAKSGSYVDLNNKPEITKQAVGLGSVENFKQYSTNNPPPYPVKSVNGQLGDVTIPLPQVEPNGTYPNMSVGNSNKLGGSEASQFVKVDSPLLQGVRILAIKLNTTLTSTASEYKAYDITGVVSIEDFDPSRDIFYVTAHAGNAYNFWADMGGGLSYRMSGYSLTARLTTCHQSTGNMQATVHRSEVVFNESTKKFRATIYPSYRFYGNSSYSPGTQMSDSQVIVDLYLIRYK